MRITAGTQNFGAAHEQAVIGFFSHGGFVNRLEETGPARAAIEFCIRMEQFFTTAFTGVGAARFGIMIFSGKCALCPLLAGDLVFFRAQPLLPFSVA